MLLLPSTTSRKPLIDVIHCCDALTLLRALPGKSVDCVVTSPPYNLNWKWQKGGGMFKNDRWALEFAKGYTNSSDAMPEDKYQAWVRDIVTECLRISKGLVWINHKTRYRDGVGIHPLSFLPFPLWSEVIWERSGSMTLNSRRFAPSHEYIFGFGRPHYWDDTKNTLMSVWHVPHSASPDHPCPYPEALIQPLIEASCPAHGIVLDPFMGSGTTATVAQRLNRHYIGSDLSPEYVRQAKERLSKPFMRSMFHVAPEVTQTPLFA